MKKNQFGFAAIEILLTLVVVGLVGAVGFYAWQRSHSVPAVTTPKSPTPHNQTDWVVYKSSHSPVQFSYPTGWKVTQSSGSSPVLESVTLYGPRNFRMDYKLEVNHVNTRMSCVLAYSGTAVPLNSSYGIVPTLDSANKNAIDGINLMSATYNDSSSGCALDFYPNPVGKTMGFTFSGAYIQPSNADGGYVQKPAEGYFNLPEVQTAKVIFASFKSR